MRSLQTRLYKEYPAHAALNFVLLESRPGCQRQAAHCDYVPTPELLAASDETIPLLFFLALEDDTQAVQRKTLQLAAGDAVVFRADLIHAGSAYDKNNIRIHAYLDHPSVKRDPNRTWIIYKHAAPEVRARIIEAPSE